jgi:glutamyl-tRNA synthetase
VRASIPGKTKLASGLEELENEAFAEALFNAVEHDGKASYQAVLGKLIARHPGLKTNINYLSELVGRAVENTNSLSIKEQQIKLDLYRVYLPIKEARRKVDKKSLPEIPNRPPVVVTRFAPNPDGPLHLGNLRAAVLSYEYAKMYSGKFILRFEDTDPKTKPPLLRAYDWIKEDLSWLGLRWDEVYIQSDRLEIYYEYARKLIELGKAYACECTQDAFKAYKEKRTGCPHRAGGHSSEIFDEMVSGKRKEGTAVLRLKSDMSHPNPALRDPALMRIIDTIRNPHPRVGSKYTVFPLYNFSAAIDDALMGVTLILRGKEHSANSLVQLDIQRKLGFSVPVSIQYGRLNLEGYILSKSRIRNALSSKDFSGEWFKENDGWDDPRLGTVMALRRRGFSPKALVELMIEVGPKPTEASISWDNLAVLNRRLVEPVAERYFAVFDPVTLMISGIADKGLSEATIPVHPSRPELGVRKLDVPVLGDKVTLSVSRLDYDSLIEGSLFRLMDLFNAQVVSKNKDSLEAVYVSKSINEIKSEKLQIIQWVHRTVAVPIRMFKPKVMELCSLWGLAEKALAQKNSGSVVQLVRVGYVRLDSGGEPITVIFTHD